MSEQLEVQPTRPVAEHAWLDNLIGEWRTESEMYVVPGGPPSHTTGTEKVVSLGGLWALGQGTGRTPDGGDLVYHFGLGFDVSFREYRGFFVASASSHLWKQTGTLSEDGRTMTLDCVGPHMVKDGETANYRDVIELVDERTRVMSSYGQDDSGEWVRFMRVVYTRV
jgi:hypothetical protein